MAKPICRISSSTAILEKCEKLRADQKSTSVDFGIEEGCIALAFFLSVNNVDQITPLMKVLGITSLDIDYGSVSPREYSNVSR